MSLDKLTALLADPGGVDFWSDFLMEEAETQLEKFDGEGWDELARSWAEWPAEWKLRLAEAVTGVKGSRASGLLTEMVFDPAGKVAQAAAAGMRFQDPLPTGDQRRKLIDRIKQLRAHADEFDAHSLELTLAAFGIE